tara:strand:- start:936 stop:1904 length:969 start_codon:yes stop_codon:yes gene_type:complete
MKLDNIVNDKVYEFNHNTDREDRIKGSILGFAIGDALGAPVEFKKEANEITDFEPSPTKGLKAGQYTDDTQHLLISLDSFIENKGKINLEDHATKLKRWYNSGEARSLGYTTKKAIERLNQGISPEISGINNINACGSLALSRLIPYSLFSALSPYENKIKRKETRDILGTTHSHRIVLNMGELINYYIQEMVHGKSAEATTYQIVDENDFLNKKIRGKLNNILESKNMDSLEAIKSMGNSGFVEDIVYSSLCAVLHGPNFRESLLNSVNSLGDSDSRAAITGSLYGLQVGYSRLPEDWKNKVEDSLLLNKKARKLYSLVNL